MPAPVELFGGGHTFFAYLNGQLTEFLRRCEQMDDSYYNLLDEQLFNEALSFAEKIFPYQKSVTGEGIDHAFEDLGNEIDCNIYEFKTGSKILDWEVPHSWKCESFQ